METPDDGLESAEPSFRLGHYGNLLTLSELTGEDVTIHAFIDLAVIIEREKKRDSGWDNTQRLQVMLQRIASCAKTGRILITELDRTVLVEGMFERDNDWGGEVFGFWKPCVDRKYRPEHNARLLELRVVDRSWCTDCLSQIEKVYSEEEV